MATTPSGAARPVPPPRPGAASAAPTPASPPTATKPKPAPDLDWLTLRPARPFGVVLRNGQTWPRVRLVEMDRWSLLLNTDQGRVLLPKHAVDAYLLDPA